MAFKKGYVPWNKGKTGKHTEETRQKISKAALLSYMNGRVALPNKGSFKKGQPGMSGMLGKKHTPEWREALGQKMRGNKFGATSMLGRKQTEEARKKIRQSIPRGSKHHAWRGGVTPLRIKIYQLAETKIWRTHIFQRDEYTCQECRVVGSELNADHIIPFSVIIQTHNIKTIEDAVACEFLWDIRNGRTLCVPCHQKTPTYGERAKNYGKTT